MGYGGRHAGGCAGCCVGARRRSGQGCFKKCAACHQIGPDAKNGLGPALTCVAGKPAGHHEGFAYSDAVKNSGVTWDDEHLLA